MNTALSSSIAAACVRLAVATNCGRKAKKKIVSFGLRMLIRTPETMTWRADRGAVGLVDGERALSRSVLQAM